MIFRAVACVGEQRRCWVVHCEAFYVKDWLLRAVRIEHGMEEGGFIGLLREFHDRRVLSDAILLAKQIPLLLPPECPTIVAGR